MYFLVTMLPWSRHFCKQNAQQSCQTYKRLHEEFLRDELFDWVSGDD